MIVGGQLPREKELTADNLFDKLNSQVRTTKRSTFFLEPQRGTCQSTHVVPPKNIYQSHHWSLFFFLNQKKIIQKASEMRDATPNIG